MCATLPLVLSFLARCIYERRGERAGCTHVYVANTRAVPRETRDAPLHRAMWNGECISALFIANRHLFVPRRSEAPVTLVRAAI